MSKPAPELVLALVEKVAATDFSLKPDTVFGVARLSGAQVHQVMEIVEPVVGMRYVPTASILATTVYYPPTEETKGLLAFDVPHDDYPHDDPGRAPIRFEVFSREFGLTVATEPGDDVTVYEVPSGQDFTTAFETVNGAKPDELGVPVFTTPNKFRGRNDFVKGVGRGEYPNEAMKDSNFHDLIDHGVSMLFFRETVARAKNMASSFLDSPTVQGETVGMIDMLANPAIGVRATGTEEDKVDVQQIINALGNHGIMVPTPELQAGALRAAEWYEKITGREIKVVMPDALVLPLKILSHLKLLSRGAMY